MGVERTDHLTELVFETVHAEDVRPHRCLECGDTAPGNKLLVFSTQRGNHSRQHDGAFCSQDCHDRYHLLKPR